MTETELRSFPTNSIALRADPQPFWVRHEGASLGIYVHIPFCVRKCFYCDFNSGPAAPGTRAAYLGALHREIRSSFQAGKPVETLFLGGGTPSELSLFELRSLIRVLQETFSFEPGAEWTIECNPGTLTREALQELRGLGFNRLSLGIQSFKDTHLRQLGRIHDANAALEAFRWARQAGFENLNVDLIFAIPQQSLNDWREDLEKALRLGPEHLSLYNLIIEAGTPFGHWAKQGALKETDDELSADMYELSMALTSAEGFIQYEISSYCRPGQECRHNYRYWKNQAYIGFGVSASSYFGGRRWTNTANWARYQAGADKGRIPRIQEEFLDREAALAEEVMLRLRTREGIHLGELSSRYRMDLRAHYAETLSFLLHNGLLAQNRERVRLTQRGKLLASEVCAEFLKPTLEPV